MVSLKPQILGSRVSVGPRSSSLRIIRSAGLAVLSLLLAAQVSGETAASKKTNLAVSNRFPAIDELGYLPPQDSASTLNPPSLAWVHEPRASGYILQWSQASDFAGAVSVSNLWLNCYTHNQPLTPGKYWWRYCFFTTDGAFSSRSETRSFAINADALPFPKPSIEECRKLLPSKHPRLLLRPEDLPRLRQLTNGAYAAQFQQLYKTAEKLSVSDPPAEPTNRGSATNKKDLEALKNWWPNRERAVQACNEAETIAFVYMLTGERRFGEAARKRVLALAAWNPDGPTNFKLNCEAAKPLLHLLARAYDWSYDTYTTEDRDRIQKAITRRIRDAWVSGEVGGGTGHINRPYNSHGNRTWHKIGESGIVFLGEIPEAERWLDYALNKYYTCYPVWADDDGGWHEGLSYFGGYMGKAVWWFQAAQAGLEIDPYKKPVLSSLCDFPLYLAPPHTPNMGFGDLSYRAEVPASWGSFMEYFVRAGSAHGAENAPYWQWWFEQWKLRPATGVLGFLHALNLPRTPVAKPPIDLPQSKVFEGIGVASLHTTLLDSRDDVHLLFKSSPRGSASHGHNPQNTFQLNAYGDALLTTCVYRDYHGSEFHTKWAHQTVAHNAVLVNGKGQLPHHARSKGRITAAKLGDEFDYVAGDATEAYEGRLLRAHRHILFLKPGLIVIFDDLAAPEPSDYQFMLHALSEFKLGETGTAAVQQPQSGALIRYLPSSKLKFRQWDGFEPKTIRGSFPNQWHLEASTADKSKELTMLTVIAPHRGSLSPKLACSRLETETAIGAQIEIDGTSWLVGFRKHAAVAAELKGITFGDSFVVKKLSN